MKNRTVVIKVLSVFIVLFGALSHSSLVHAQTSSGQEDLGLCPPGFDQGVVTTGFVECDRESRRQSNRENAELERLQREAICNAHPNSEVTSSGIFGTPSGGFFSRVICTVTRSVSPGTVLCPLNSEEVYRAFDTLVCQDFGNAFSSLADAQQSLAEQITECTTTNSGVVIDSDIMGELFDDVMFYTASVACVFATAATDNIECPFGFDELSRDDDSIQCRLDERPFDSLAEADDASTAAQAICSDTTAGLGSVTEVVTGATSIADQFSSTVECEISIARFGDFTGEAIIRACDATCTEEIEQDRLCLNGGVIGGPGCIESATQTVERRCNTGTRADGLCPLVVTPNAIAPILLLDDDEQ